MRKISAGTGDGQPIIAYYQYKSPDEPNDKVRVLVKDQKIVGIYEHTFVDETGKYKNHLIRTTEGKVTVKGATGLNNNLASIEKNTPVLLQYLGKGKKKPGQHPPFLWDTFELSQEELEEVQEQKAPKAAAKPVAKQAAPKAAAVEVEADEEAEEETDELPF